MTSLRERAEKRLVGLKQVRSPYEADWREIARLASPSRTRFNNSETNKNTRQRNTALYSSHGIQAFRTLTGGMTSGLTSSSRPWFMLATHDEALMEDPEVRSYLTEVEKRMYSFLAGTNFYGAVKTGYSELGMFGTEAGVMLEHKVHGAVCHALTAGEYWIGVSDAMMPDTLYRRVPMTVSQAMGSFGADKVSSRVRDAYDRSDYEQTVQVMHAMEPNTERDIERMDSAGKPHRSIWWDEQDDQIGHKLLRESGYWEQPFWAPRWDTTGSDAYGQGPGMDALPDLRELQLQTKRKAEATDFHIHPEIIVPASVKLKRQPKSVVAASSVDAANVKVPYEIPYQAIAAIREDITDCKQSIDSATYADLFMAITNMQGIQPRNIEEIASRNEEKLTQLGPVIERVNTEKLEVAIDRTFGIMSRMGLFPDAPEALADTNLKVDFVSILTQMQRMVGIGQIERTTSFIGNLAGLFPEAGDKLNIDEMIDEYAERAGAPQKIIRTAKEVEGIRANRAQQQKMAQMAEMAPAARDGAEAARLLAETDANGNNVLQSLMPS